MRYHSFLGGLNVRSGRNPLCQAWLGSVKSFTATANGCIFMDWYGWIPNPNGVDSQKPGARSDDAKLSVTIQGATPLDIARST